MPGLGTQGVIMPGLGTQGVIMPGLGTQGVIITSYTGTQGDASIYYHGVLNPVRYTVNHFQQALAHNESLSPGLSKQ
jgi:hypothetical protein